MLEQSASTHIIHIQPTNTHTIIETDNYLLYLDMLKFKPHFNKDVILSNISNLIMGASFNKAIILPDDLLNLTMGWVFNQPIILPQNLESLIMGNDFNQPLILPQKLVNFVMGNEFNQPLILPQNLLNCTIGCRFDKPIVLVHSILYLKLDLKCNDEFINNLPSNLKTLELGNHFDGNLSRLKSTISILKFDRDSRYNHLLNNLPRDLEELELPKDYNKKISNVPNGLKKLICHENYKYIHDYVDCNVETYC